MFKDKRPGKWLLLAALLAAIVIGLLLFFGMQAKAANGKFLPIKDITTPGGISVWLVEDHSLPIVSMNFLFLDSGTALDPQDKQGLARMLSNTMDEGAGELDSQAFQKMLSDHSITLAFSASRDGFGGQLKSLTRNSALAFGLLERAMNAPRFDEEAVARMKAGNLSRIKSSLSEPDWMAARLINDKAYPGHPYGKNSGGTISGIEKITPQDLRDFKEKYLTRDRLLVAAVGDIDPETLGPAIDKAFGKLPAKGPAVDITDVSIANGGKIYLYGQPIPQTMVEIMLPAVDSKDPDYYAQQVMNYIYGGAGFGSRLMEEAREKGGLTYGIYSGVVDYRHNDALTISTSTKNGSAKQMLDIVSAQMLRLRNEPVAAKELKDAKSYLIGSIPLHLTSSDQIAGMMMSLRTRGLPIDYLDRLEDKINAITPADIQRVANRILKPEGMVTVLVGKPEQITNADIVKELPNVQ
ncbi:MAG TPA: pitrilysin family protein [Micavibrio sp.]|nr:pitrilysin family protein [Micavibrio sp.]